MEVIWYNVTPKDNTSLVTVLMNMIHCYQVRVLMLAFGITSEKHMLYKVEGHVLVKNPPD